MSEKPIGEQGTATTITAAHRRALLMADDVCFYLHEGRSWLVCSLGARHAPRVFSRHEQLVFPDDGALPGSRAVSIGCGVSLHGYSGDYWGSTWHGDRDNRAHCFAMLHGAKSNRAWQTIATLVKPGDRLTLSWAADNNNDLITAAGLHADQLSLLISRGARTVYEFVVRHEVAPDGPARMIRRNG
jgi:hypothetical protein